MKKRLNLFVRLASVITLIAMLLAPAVALAFTPTINEFSVPFGTGAEPFHIAAGPDGNMWFTEQIGNNIGKITPNGTITEYSVPTGGAQPGSIAAGPDGNMWFTEFSGGHVGKITPSGTVTEYNLPSGGKETGGIAAGPDGNMWISLINSNTIDKVSMSGSITQNTVASGGDLQYVAAGPDGNMWFTEQGNNKIGKMSTSGTVLAEYTVPTSSSEPQDIVSGPDGNMWFTEFGGDKIGKVTTSGTFTEYAVPTPSAVPWGITVGPDNMLWFGEQNANKVGRVSTSGTITEYTVPTSNSFPTGIATGADGNMWFTEINKDKIGQLILPVKPSLPGTKSATAVSGKSTVIDVTTGVSGNPDPSSVTIVSGPSHGTAVDPPGTITYTPNAGYTGSDSLTYQVCSLDDAGICTQAVLGLSVVADPVAPTTGFGINNSISTPQILAIFSLASGTLFALAFSMRKKLNH